MHVLAANVALGNTRIAAAAIAMSTLEGVIVSILADHRSDALINLVICRGCRRWFWC